MRKKGLVRLIIVPVYWCIAFLLIISILFNAGCNDNYNQYSSNGYTKEPTEEEIRLSTFEYSYDSLINDLIQYCCYKVESSVGGYYYGLYKSKLDFLSKNKSVESLIDKTLIEKMRENNIDDDVVYYIAMAFPDSWDKNKKLVVYNNNFECYYPLFVTYLKEVEYKTFEAKVISVIKSHLRDPESFYMTTETDAIKYSWNLYVKCYKGDTLYYVDENGVYTGDIYFYVEYYAKNGFGGYNKSGAWLSYSSSGYVGWTGNVGNNEFHSGYNLYGDYQNLGCCGYVNIRFN